MIKLIAYGIAAVVVAAGVYLFIDVWSVGWIKHDGTITITVPENQKEFFDYAY